MKNVTVSLDDETFRRARLRAAEAGRSLSAMVREYLRGLGEKETEFERLARLEQELYARIDAEGGGLRASDRLSRDELYDEAFRERFPTLTGEWDRAEEAETMKRRAGPP